MHAFVHPQRHCCWLRTENNCYRPGETVRTHVSVRNDSDTTLTGIAVMLVRSEHWKYLKSPRCEQRDAAAALRPAALVTDRLTGCHCN